MGSDQQNNTRYYQHNRRGSHPNQNGNPHSHDPDPNNGPPPAINYTARPNNAPANNQHTANLAIQSAPPANYYHQQPATDHGTHPNHQSLQQHYSGAPPADQLARGHNNGAPWPNVYVSHNNYGAPPANESASDPNYGAPPAHQSAQGHNYGAPQANQYVPQPPTNNYAPWPNEYVEHHNHSTQETSYVRLQQGAHRGYPQISKQPTIAQDVSPLGVDSLPGHGFFQQLQTSSHQPQINAQPDMLPDLTDWVHPTSEFNELGSRFSAYSPPDCLDNKKATTPWLPSNGQKPLASDVHMDVGLDQLGVRKDVGSDIHTGASSMSQDPPMPGPSSTVPLPPVVRPTGIAPEDVVLTLQEIEMFDYTSGAPLDEPPHYKFNNVDDLKKFAQTWGQAHAYRLPVSKSKAGKNIYMDCSLSGEDPRPAGVERIRESKNRRCNCPFRVSGHKSSAEGHKNNPWELRGSKLPHNHGPIDIQYEVVHKGLPPDAQDEVGRLYSLGLQPAAIQRWLNTTQGRFVSLRTIYNTTAEQRRKKISNETPIQFLLRTVRDSNWDHDTAFDDKDKSPKVFVTDRERALRNAIALHFPGAENNVCLWHVDQNIKANCQRAFAGDKAEWNVFKSKWNEVQYAKTKAAYDSAWARLVNYLGDDRASVVKYLMTNVLPDRKFFMTAWVGHTPHLGNHTTARGESAHSWLKSHMHSHKAGMANSFENIADAVTHQLTTNTVHLENGRISSLSGIELPFKSLHGKISIHALHLVQEQYQLWKKNTKAQSGGADTTKCTGSLWATMGIPCWHMLDEIFAKEDEVTPSHFHLQWNLRYHPDKPDEEEDYDFDADFNTLKEELLANHPPAALERVMRKIRQVVDNTHVVPMAPVIDTIRTSSRKEPKRRKKLGRGQVQKRDAIYAEIVDGEIQQAQDAKAKATGATSQVQGKREAKAHTGPSKRTQPIRDTKITKRARNADGDSSSSESEPEDTSASQSGSSDSEASAEEDGSSNPDEAPCASHMNPQDDLAADDSQVDTVGNPVLDRPDASLPLGAGVAEPSAMEGGGSGRDGTETSAHAMGKPSDVKPPMKRKVVPKPVRMPTPGNLLLPTWISKYAQSTYDAPGDGNCGFRCVAQALASEQPESAYAKQDGWFQVRTDLIQELHANKAHWTGRLGGPSEIKRVIESLTVDPQATSVPSGKWMSKLDLGPIVANAYNRPVVFLTSGANAGASTYLPSTKAPDSKVFGAIFLLFICGNHWNLVNLKRGIIPYPPPVCLPRHTRGKPVELWLEKINASLTLYTANQTE
ncbi:hypothetical protein MJO28_000328 [Puccinia striiformis f. sp. tritici]|uniref:Uncharacterized protein n=1 Tax=Puccinia striiformis f. sp. tritici TaxID=168172 RepID=A0ACC0EWY7_9BASI|nr:hypothetical protein MJO28_000328 [Puccinia striiformis f. sp. tritici]